MKFIDKKSLTFEFAQEMAAKAEERAKQLGVAVNISIVDEGGHLLFFARMTGAPILSVDIAQNKAYSAAAFGLPTDEWYSLIKGDPALLHGMVHTERLVIFGGGFPIKVKGEIAGAIGVSGGSALQDIECCKAALELLES